MSVASEPPVVTRSHYFVAASKGRYRKTKKTACYDGYDLDAAAAVLSTRWDEQKRGLWDRVNSWVEIELKSEN